MKAAETQARPSVEERPGGIDVSVVIPVYNEGGHLKDEVDRIRRAFEGTGYRWEIVMVDDGSTDGSADELMELEGVRLIRFAENRGTGTARKVGTQAARGKVVVWTDADMTLPNDRIPWLVPKLAGYDQVVGARTSEQGSVKLLRRPAKWAIRRLASYLVRTPIPDLNCGFRAFRRDVGMQFLDLLPKGFSCTTTMTMTFLANGYAVRHVPIEYVAREEGKSKFHWWSDTKQYITQVIRMVLSYEPLRVFMPLGLGLIAMGIGKMIFDWITKDFRLSTNTLLLFFAALQAISTGFLADLMVRLNKRRFGVPPASLQEPFAGDE